MGSLLLLAALVLALSACSTAEKVDCFTIVFNRVNAECTKTTKSDVSNWYDDSRAIIGIVLLVVGVAGAAWKYRAKKNDAPNEP